MESLKTLKESIATIVSAVVEAQKKGGVYTLQEAHFIYEAMLKLDSSYNHVESFINNLAEDGSEQKTKET